MATLSPSKVKTATVAEMIYRFHNAKPTSRAVREAMQHNGDGPTRMWYEEKTSNTSTVEKDAIGHLELDSTTAENKGTGKISDADIVAEFDCMSHVHVLPRKEKKKSNWRQRFKSGLKNVEEGNDTI